MYVRLLMLSLFALVASAAQLSASAQVSSSPPRALVFGVPSIVSGPECPTSQGGGPWWDKVRAVSDTHALGWAESHVIATKDAGKTWYTLVFNDSCAGCGAGTSRIARPGPSITGPFHTLGHLNLTRGSKDNVTGTGAVASTHFSVDANGEFVRKLVGPINISGLPNLRMYAGSGDSIRLRDGSHVLVAKSVLGTGDGKLSCVAIRSVGGGFNWTFASVVASTAEVPYAAEGPSEASLAVLTNGTLMAVMRVEGQSGHYSPYISKLSDDGGLTWHSLRQMRGSWGPTATTRNTKQQQQQQQQQQTGAEPRAEQ